MDKIKLIYKITLSLFAITAWSLVMLLFAIFTFFQARRFYNETLAKHLANLVLRIWGIKILTHMSEPLPLHQTIYISNHISTLDIFILISLGLPKCRYFLSGFLRKHIPIRIIAYIMGTFFTCCQSKPKQRAQIFAKAEQTLIKTGESVYSSPEGERVTTGEIGHFNKGAFHLATNLKAPIIPIFIQIPVYSNPGIGFAAQPGVVQVFFKPPLKTDHWQLEDLIKNKKNVRELFLAYHAEHVPQEFQG